MKGGREYTQRDDVIYKAKKAKRKKWSYKDSRFRSGVNRIVALLGADHVMLDGPLEHLDDPILPVPPPIGAHDADAARNALQRRALAAPEGRDGHEPALARKVVCLRDRAPVHIVLLLRRRAHRPQDPHHPFRRRPAERPRPLPRQRTRGRRVARHHDVDHLRAVRLRERARRQARRRLHPRQDAIVRFIEIGWVHFFFLSFSAFSFFQILWTRFGTKCKREKYRHGSSKRESSGVGPRAGGKDWMGADGI